MCLAVNARHPVNQHRTVGSEKPAECDKHLYLAKQKQVVVRNFYCVPASAIVTMPAIGICGGTGVDREKKTWLFFSAFPNHPATDFVEQFGERPNQVVLAFAFVAFLFCRFCLDLLFLCLECLWESCATTGAVELFVFLVLRGDLDLAWLEILVTSTAAPLCSQILCEIRSRKSILTTSKLSSIIHNMLCSRDTLLCLLHNVRLVRQICLRGAFLHSNRHYPPPAPSSTRLLAQSASQ